MRHLIASVPSVPIRILLVAFLTTAFALLWLLPAFSQATFDRTDGRISSGGLSVGVFADITDAQLQKNREDTYTNTETNETTTVYLPDGPRTNLGTAGFLNRNDTAYLANPLVSPQKTFFGDTLWVSNKPGAYNTVLITAESDGVTLPVGSQCAVATVRTSSATNPIAVEMVETADTGGTTYYQAFVRVLDSRADNEDGTAMYASSAGPACDDADDTNNETPDYETRNVDQDATATIVARHGDRITVNVAGAGEVTVEVDGEGPELLDITPEDLSYVRSRNLDFTFTVRDNDAGLRHDGELVVSEDGDYTEVNEDEDHVTAGEPLSMPSGGQISVNGDAAEIDLVVWAEEADPNSAGDITETGSWTLVGGRPGVAYAFSADGSSRDEGAYYMEITAFDRVGNRTVSEAPDDEQPGPHWFTVDDTDPAAGQSWTGIAYDPDLKMGEKVVGGEIADRSWIMAEFTEPLRLGVAPGQIRVAGHEVVGVYQPNYAPPFMREVVGRNSLAGTQRLTFAPPAPRAAASLAPQAPRAAASLAPQAQGTCTVPASGTRITSLDFNYDGTTGDATISWDRLGDHDCNGYRLAILVKNAVLIVEDLDRFNPDDNTSNTWTYNIPRASELGRYIEAQIRDTDENELRILAALRYASVGSHTDNFGSADAAGTFSLDGLTAPSTRLATDAALVEPYLLHPPSVPAVLPEVLQGDAELECNITSGNSDEVFISLWHRPTPDDTPSGWERVGYYWQLFYPPDYEVGLDRAFKYTALGADGFWSSVSYQGFFPDWETRQDFNAQGEIAAVYEDGSGRRLAGAVRTLWCSASKVSNPTLDRIPPWLLSTSVDGATLRLTYNENLNTASEPHTSAYRVSGRSVRDVDVSGRVVTLTLSTPITSDEGVTLNYRPPPYGPIEDLAGNDASRIRNWRVQTGEGGGNGGENWDFGSLTHEEALAEAGYWPIDINGELIEDTRTRIYIELADELRADETPVVAFFSGAAYDLAGNANASEDVQTRDGIAPRFTITVTGTAQDRPVASTRGQFVVDVRADEDLRRRPEVYFTGIAIGKVTRNGDDAYDYSIANAERGGTLATQEDAQHWRGTYLVSDLSGVDELFGLAVYGFDYEDNIGESGGWKASRHQRKPTAQTTPKPGDALDLEKMDAAGALLEIDRGFNGGIEPVHAVAPSRRMRDNETESVNPFISITFPMEADEYAVCPADGCGAASENLDAEFSDSHATVNITAITLNGADATSQLSRVDAGRFVLVATGLELGEYEIEYTAVDEAGNDYDGEFVFSVLERSPYELEVMPGWNLISFPGTPEDPSLGGVVPIGTLVSPVLAYQNGDWLTAVKNEEGEWAGNLTGFEAGFGYWLFADTFATLAPLIPDPEQTATLPTAPVRHGWNLLGVIDVFQNPAGTPPGPDDGDGEADNYFRSIPWRVIYTYNTVYSLWVRSVPDADKAAPEGTSADEPGFRLVGEGDKAQVVTQEILNGKGYWVWSAEPATLVP